MYTAGGALVAIVIAALILKARARRGEVKLKDYGREGELSAWHLVAFERISGRCPPGYRVHRNGHQVAVCARAGAILGVISFHPENPEGSEISISDLPAPGYCGMHELELELDKFIERMFAPRAA